MGIRAEYYYCGQDVERSMWLLTMIAKVTHGKTDWNLKIRCSMRAPQQLNSDNGESVPFFSATPSYFGHYGRA